MVYIASRYANQDTNRHIAALLRRRGLDVFLPRELKVRSHGAKNKRHVYRRCIEELSRCTTVLVISPFGRDVAYEIGYACHMGDMRELPAGESVRNPAIVRFNTTEETSVSDDMFFPDFESSDLDDVIAYIFERECRMNPGLVDRHGSGGSVRELKLGM